MPTRTRELGRRTGVVGDVSTTARFVRHVATVVVTIATPSQRDAAVVGAAERLLVAFLLRAERRNFVTSVAAVVVAVAQPVAAHADVVRAALDRKTCEKWIHLKARTTSYTCMIPSPRYLQGVSGQCGPSSE